MLRTYDRVRMFRKEDRDVFNLIQKEGPIAKRLLLERTGLKMTKLNLILDELEELTLIERVGNGDSTGGRRPILFDAVKKGNYILSLTMGSLHYTVALTNLKMDVLARREGSMSAMMKPPEFFSEVMQHVEDILRETGISKEQILGLGASTVGCVDRETGQIKKESSFYINDSWIDFPLRYHLQELTGLPVYCDIGVNAQTLANNFYVSKKKAESMIVVVCGMSVRTGVVVNGKLVRHRQLSDDTFGHMTINMDGALCKCGNYGCVECYASLASIQRAFMSGIKIGRKSCIRIERKEDLTVEMLEDACRRGDAFALEVISTSAAALGCGIANYVNLFDPDLVVLTGLLIERSDTFYHEVVRSTQKRLSCLNRSRAEIVRDDNYDQIFTIAGAALFFEEWINE